MPDDIASGGEAKKKPEPEPPCVDSHAHLSMEAFDSDRGEVIRRATDDGIRQILTASTSLADASRNIAVAQAHAADGVWAAAGFHPHQAKEWDESSEAALEALLGGERVVAIGETGLDYHYRFSPEAVQRDVFAKQVRLASRMSLPIIVHCREAASDVATILDGEGGGRHGGVIHCFTEDAAFAERCLALGFYISFSGILTFKNAEDLRDVARAIPRDRLLVETDSPYLAPIPHRGERNEPRRAAVVLQALAAARGEDPAALAKAITANFARFIRRPSL